MLRNGMLHASHGWGASQPKGGLLGKGSCERDRQSDQSLYSCT